MTQNKTRIRLTWYAEIVLSGFAALSMYLEFEGIATACIAGIITITTGYQAAKSWTNNQAAKNTKQ